MVELTLFSLFSFESHDVLILSSLLLHFEQPHFNSKASSLSTQLQCELLEVVICLLVSTTMANHHLLCFIFLLV